jgi:hypothetical protein
MVQWASLQSLIWGDFLMNEPATSGSESCACGKTAEYRVWRMIASDVICIRPLWPNEPNIPAKFCCLSCLPAAVIDFVSFVALS